MHKPPRSRSPAGPRRGEPHARSGKWSARVIGVLRAPFDSVLLRWAAQCGPRCPTGGLLESVGRGDHLRYDSAATRGAGEAAQRRLFALDS